MEVAELLVKNGWSSEGAALIAKRIDEPTAYAVRRLVAKVRGEKYVAPRKPSKPKKHINAKLRKAVFERDAYRCRHCGDWHDLSVDHITPESWGGTTELYNLQALCIVCNCRKNNKYVG